MENLIKRIESLIVPATAVPFGVFAESHKEN